MLIHRPPRTGAGQELWEGLIRAREEGFTIDIGVGNYRVEQMLELAEATGETPTVNQIEWSPFGYSEEMTDFCRRKRILIQAYSPLTRAERLGDRTLAEIAGRCGKTPAQPLIRWNLESGSVPLPKANRREHLEENLDVFDFDLGGDMATLNALNEHYSSLTVLPYV